MQLVAREYNTKVPPGMKPMYIDDTFNKKNLIKVSECPCCDSKFEEVLSLKSENENVPVLSRGFCKACGYFGAFSTLSPSWIEDYYLKHWNNTQDVNDSEMTSDLSNTRPYDMISKHLSSKDARILDAGAGYGSSLRVFLENGYSNVEALELSTRRVKTLKKRYQIKVDNIPLEQLHNSKELSGEYDVVYLWHVFEHLSRLQDCLKALEKSIKKEGLLFIAVPYFPEEHFTNLVNLHVHMHTFQDFTLHFLMSKYGFELVDNTVNYDGGGIRALYKKTGNYLGTGNPNLLPRRQDIIDQYNKKIFQDYQLMFLVHQPKEMQKNALLTFHYNSSFAGTNLIKYPTGFLNLLCFKLDILLNDVWSSNSITHKILRRLINKWSKHLGLAQGTLFFKEIDGLPSDPYPFRLIFNKPDIIKIDFVHKDKHIKLWLE